MVASGAAADEGVILHPRRSTEDKHQTRRDQLAESALVTLGELGYARTGLRDIAANSPFSHGVVHYYFRDKNELIVYCVRFHKSRCVQRYDDIIERSTTADELVDGFIGKLRLTLTSDAPMHRLWYDLRSASMFEEPLRETVDVIDGWLLDMVWRVVSRYAELAGCQIARFLVLHKELDADDGELTRTRKVRRGAIAEKYGVLIDALYGGLAVQHIETQVRFEDGRTGVVAADLRIVDSKRFPVAREAA